ncbi:class I SAM-dependent methyltransferase [Methanobrevibacter sp.]|uniref:SAM-dependent methyltransferase n=1 Tax=Methanobrevibacter sp. TaxID=66852 RepID=UPI0025FA2659|nr:class I SAM-dependent methyltransferase [Methanobrevibacter sp.]MBQ2962275.1 class I SAM-dependent methyltransferase [Methanobrevibacter sp.]
MNYQRLYEDADLENEIYDIICDGEDIFDVLKRNNHYEYHYFLSPLRQNLFHWYPFKKEGSLLEIGAGYGQLTSLFTEKLGRVVAVEESESKCKIISKRAEDAEVIVSDFNDIELDEKFDYIVLCNVFEYAKSFVQSENPYVDYLDYLKKFLKDDGVILLALSNRLGLKYFAGYKEEHTNQYFNGINGYSDIDFVQTFAKTEICNIIDASGFSNYKFFYPYPNHEFPQVINTDRFINEIPYTGVNDYSSERTLIFDEVKLNLSLSQENLSQYFANSFLIEIRSSDMTYPTDKIDYVKLGTDRKEEFNIYTTIWSDGKVSKTPISTKSNDHIKKMFEGSTYVIGKIKCLNAEMNDNALYYDFLKQKSCEYLLLDAIADDDKDKFFKLIEDYYDALFYNSFESNAYCTEEFLKIFKVKSDIKFHCHKKSYLDSIFANMFLIDGEFTLIDYEWIFDFPIPLEYIFYRSFNYHFYSNSLIREFTNFEEIFEHFNLDIGNLKLFMTWECNFLRYIIKRPNRPPYTKSKIKSIENIEKNDKLQKEIDLKNAEIKKKEKEIKKKDKEIKSFLNSNSWKMTKPIRKVKSILKKN